MAVLAPSSLGLVPSTVQPLIWRIQAMLAAYLPLVLMAVLASGTWWLVKKARFLLALKLNNYAYRWQHGTCRITKIFKTVFQRIGRISNRNTVAVGHPDQDRRLIGLKIINVLYIAVQHQRPVSKEVLFIHTDIQLVKCF